MRPRRDTVAGVTSLPAGLSSLAAEFPGYEFGLQRSWGGTSFVAVRNHGSAQPGLYAVVTADLDELRRALLEGEQTRPPPE
jgi:hypothetical protein